jgi:hypothetical protein
MMLRRLVNNILLSLCGVRRRTSLENLSGITLESEVFRFRGGLFLVSGDWRSFGG